MSKKTLTFTDRQLTTLYGTDSYFVVEFNNGIDIWCIRNGQCKLHKYKDPFSSITQNWHSVNWNCALTKKDVARSRSFWKHYAIIEYKTYEELNKVFDIERAPND